MNKIPTLVIYWADTYVLLTHTERRMVEQDCDAVAVTPEEVLLVHGASGRNVVIRGTLDAFAPKIPT